MRRPLALALLASLVLHVLVLYALPMVKESIRAPARPLLARLAKAAPEPVKAEPPPRALAPSPPARPTQVARPARQLAAPEPVAVAPVPSAEPAKPAAEPALALPAAPLTAAAQVPVARADVAPASAPAASGPDPGTIARYRLDLMNVAPRYKRYPRIAQDNNWEGRVELRIAIGVDGAISSFTVRKSTGRAVLDNEAQAMLRTAHANIAVPPALRGTAFNLDIAVDFFLKEER